MPDPNNKHQTMKTITNSGEIAAALDKFRPSEEAYATCRCLPGQWEQENCQEWAERGEIGGSPATVFYLFTNEEAGEDMGGLFDLWSVSKIEIED